LSRDGYEDRLVISVRKMMKRATINRIVREEVTLYNISASIARGVAGGFMGWHSLYGYLIDAYCSK
jgi:hypothetical protein